MLLSSIVCRPWCIKWFFLGGGGRTERVVLRCRAVDILYGMDVFGFYSF